MVVQPAALALCCCTTSAALLIGWRLGRRGLAARAGATALAPGVEGRLYNYRPSGSFNALQAFESPASHGFTKYVVYVGGLTDGLLACPYVPALGEACQRVGWALVQPLLSSSYIGYGTGSLDRDADELSLLLGFLAAERGATAVALVGHSTGCQDAAHCVDGGRTDSDFHPPCSSRILRFVPCPRQLGRRHSPPSLSATPATPLAHRMPRIVRRRST